MRGYGPKVGTDPLDWQVRGGLSEEVTFEWKHEGQDNVKLFKAKAGIELRKQERSGDFGKGSHRSQNR